MFLVMTVPKETINIHFISQSKRIIFIFRFSDRNIKNRHKSTQQHDEQLEIGSVLHSSNFIPNIIVNTHIVRQLRFPFPFRSLFSLPFRFLLIVISLSRGYVINFTILHSCAALLVVGAICFHFSNFTS